jgi:hypothetical protein
LGGAAVAQGLAEPSGHADAGPLDDPLELTQPIFFPLFILFWIFGNIFMVVSIVADFTRQSV